MSRVTLEGKTVGESALTPFDFLSRLASGETISTASVTATVYSGTDASPSSIINGSATISGSKAIQMVVGGVLGVTYLLKCTVTTSLGQTRQLMGFLVIIPDQE